MSITLFLYVGQVALWYSARPRDCEFNSGSRQLLGERDSTLSLTQAELYGLQLHSSGVIVY